MTRLHVVFDTNIYRSDVDFVRLGALERQCRVQPLATHFTIMELGAHLADPTDPAFAIAKRGLSSLYHHTAVPGSTTDEIPFIADSEAQMARSLFGFEIPSRHAQHRVYSRTLATIAKHHSSTWDDATRQVLAALRQHRDRVEADFPDDMRRAVLSIDPSATGWIPFAQDQAKRKEWVARVRAGEGKPFTARALVIKAARNAGVVVSDNELAEMATWVQGTFAAAVQFFSDLILKSIESGIDFSKAKHANSIWDFQLMHLVGADAACGAVPLVLVSNEQAMWSAASAVGAPDRVWKLDDYLWRLEAVADGRLATLGPPAL